MNTSLLFPIRSGESRSSGTPSLFGRGKLCFHLKWSPFDPINVASVFVVICGRRHYASCIGINLEHLFFVGCWLGSWSRNSYLFLERIRAYQEAIAVLPAAWVIDPVDGISAILTFHNFTHSRFLQFHR